MKRSVCVLLLANLLYSMDTNTLIDCNKIFEQRKDELVMEIEKIDEEQQALEALQTATQTMLEQRETALAKREMDVNATLQMIENEKKRIEQIKEDNEKLLEAIKKAKDDRISETYAKMKANKAAPILEAMDKNSAAQIMFTLQPKVLSAIMAKMTPVAASDLTKVLQKGPPFKDTPQAIEASRQTPAL